MRSLLQTKGLRAALKGALSEMSNTVEKRIGRWLKYVRIAENGYWIWTGSLQRYSGTNFTWDAPNLSPVTPEHVFMFGTIPELDLYAAIQNVNVELGWVSDADSLGIVRWRTILRVCPIVEAWDVTFGTVADSVRVAGDSLHVVGLSLAAPTLAPGDDFILKISRVATHANDTYPVDTDLVRVRMYAVFDDDPPGPNWSREREGLGKLT